MELFGVIGWISVPQLILQYIDLPAETLTELIANERLYWWITLGVGGGLYLLGLIFGGFGLMKLAKRAGIKHGWIGFLPFANTYLAGELAGEANMFGAKIKRIGLITMLFEIAFVLLNLFSMILELIVLQPGYWEPSVQASGSTVFGLSKDMLGAAGMGWIYTILHYDILGIINYVFSLVVLFIFCTLFFAFYRKYYARSPFLMTFLSAVLPARGFAIFAVRNNTPVDYTAYMRRRMQQQYEQQLPYDGNYGDGSYPPPSQPSRPVQPMPPEEPFGDEFGGAPRGGSPGGTAQGNPPPSDDDPFSDF